MADYFSGYEFFLDEPNRINDIKDDIVRAVLRRDNLTGVFSHKHQTNKPRYTKAVSYALLSREAIIAHDQWLERRAGRLVPFWFPSWQTDLTLARDIEPGQTFIRIENIGYTKHYLPTGGRRRVILFLRGGGNIRSYIMTSTDNGDGTESLYFDFPFTFKIPMEDVIMTSFVYLVRLDVDRVTRRWETQDLMTVNFPVIEVVGEAAESE
ncbi:hypothetical protein [Acetonema longum]|uniref:hypothetical protein n=1 Tax=Acetonema longum TaxID=2374 RepID=UPI0002D4EE70|nr:hypothetical protein [Acetonema longum]